MNERLKELKIEEFIWIIYIGIIILSFYSNNLERNYFIYKDNISKEKYRKIMILIFSVLIVVYYYFLKDSYESVKELNIYDTYKKKHLTYLSFLASLFIFASGLIFLYVAYQDQDIDVELAFN